MPRKGGVHSAPPVCCPPTCATANTVCCRSEVAAWGGGFCACSLGRNSPTQTAPSAGGAAGLRLETLHYPRTGCAQRCLQDTSSGGKEEKRLRCLPWTCSWIALLEPWSLPSSSWCRRGSLSMRSQTPAKDGFVESVLTAVVLHTDNTRLLATKIQRFLASWRREWQRLERDTQKPKRLQGVDLALVRAFAICPGSGPPPSGPPPIHKDSAQSQVSN